MSNRRRLVRLVALGAALALLAGCTVTRTESAPSTDHDTDGQQEQVVGAELAAASQDTPFIVHRTETCGCCGAYEEILEEAGVRIEASVHADLSHVRAAFGVPESEASCHTGQIGGYAIEGHMPLEAIEQLLREAPDVDGIALAGMPAGSPGMPGTKAGSFVVQLIDGGQLVGEFGRF